MLQPLSLSQFHFSNLQWPRMRFCLSFRPSCCCPALISAASGAARQRALACLTLPRATQRQTGRVKIDSAFGRSDLRRVSPGQTVEQRSRTVTHSRLADDWLSEKPSEQERLFLTSAMWRPISLQRKAREKCPLTEKYSNSR